MTLTWYGHSCFRLESADGSLVFDPYAPGSVPGLELKKLTADAVICSHEHADHNFRDAVSLTGKPFTGRLTSVECFHDDREGRLRGKNTVTVAEAQGLRIVHLGDLGHELSDSQLSAIGKPDILMLPVGGHYTVDGTAARRIADALSARIVVPMHYRGARFGYSVISTADDFLAMSENVRYFDTNVLCDADMDGKFTAVLSLNDILP